VEKTSFERGVEERRSSEWMATVVMKDMTCERSDKSDKSS